MKQYFSPAQLCGKGFSRSHHLKRHKESVHKEGSKNRPQASSSSGASSTPSASSSLPKLSKFSKRQPSSTSSTLQPSSRTIALEGGMLRLEDSLGGETVLVTTEEEAEGAVMVGDIQHEYIIEGQPGIKYTTCKFVTPLATANCFFGRT